MRKKYMIILIFLLSITNISFANTWEIISENWTWSLTNSWEIVEEIIEIDPLDIINDFTLNYEEIIPVNKEYIIDLTTLKEKLKEELPEDNFTIEWRLDSISKWNSDIFKETFIKWWENEIELLIFLDNIQEDKSIKKDLIFKKNISLLV